MSKLFKCYIPKLILNEINKSNYPKKDDLFVIINLIRRKTAHFKTETQKYYGYNHISRKEFSTLISNNNSINDAKKFLIDQEMIIENSNYSKDGGFSKSYKLNHDLLSNNVEVVISDKFIIKRFTKIEFNRKRSFDKILETQQNSYFNNFEIDYPSAHQFIYDEAFNSLKNLCKISNILLTDQNILDILESKNNFIKDRFNLLLVAKKEFYAIMYRYINQDVKIRMIKDKYLYFKRNNTNGRLDTNLTNLPSSLRRFIKSPNKLLHIDIKNSQPYFLFCLLKAENIISENELVKYRDVVTTGFYEYLIQEWKARYGVKRSRKEMKDLAFKLFFSKTKSYRKIKVFFGELFPEIMNYIDMLNDKDNSTLANKLTTLESGVVISIIFTKLGLIGINPFTIHDSFIVSESESGAVTDLINETLTLMYGIAPKLHITSLYDDIDEIITDLSDVVELENIEEMSDEEFYSRLAGEDSSIFSELFEQCVVYELSPKYQ